MLTQDNVGQANPRFWVVMQNVKEYYISDGEEGMFVYSNNDAESVETEEERMALTMTEEEMIEFVSCNTDYYYTAFKDRYSDIYDFITATEASELTGISVRGIRDNCERGRYVCRKSGSTWIIAKNRFNNTKV